MSLQVVNRSSRSLLMTTPSKLFTLTLCLLAIAHLVELTPQPFAVGDEERGEGAVEEVVQSGLVEDVGRHRQPRLLLRTTTTTTVTSTVSSSTLCFVTNGAFLALCARRRRREAAFIDEAPASLDKDLVISPSQTFQAENLATPLTELESGSSGSDLDELGRRHARLLFSLFFTTTTTSVTTTVTTVTSTSTFTLDSNCSPVSFSYTLCT